MQPCCKFRTGVVLLLIISVCSCSFNLERPELPKYFSCYSAKCCYDLDQERQLQVCGFGSPNEFNIGIRHQN